MCIRDSENAIIDDFIQQYKTEANRRLISFELIDNINIIDCLLYTSDAADERSSVDLGGRRIIKKKKRSNDVRRLTLTRSTSRTSRMILRHELTLQSSENNVKL